MAYDLPTVQDVRSRFANLASTTKYPDALIQSLIDEAARQVDTSWIEADFQTAVLYLVAHLASVEKQYGSGGAELASESVGGIFSVSYRETKTELESTVYGKRFLALLKRNKPAFLTTSNYVG